MVEADRNQLSEIVQQVRDGRLHTNVGKITTLTDAASGAANNSGRPLALMGYELRTLTLRNSRY